MEGRRSQRRGERIPTVLWFTLKRSMHCKSEPSEVHDPKFGTKLGSILTKRSVGRSGCSRSIANLKDVIHGSKSHFQRPTTCSPRSIGSSEFLNPISHEVILSDSRCELRIVTGFGGCHESGTAAELVGTLRPGTPGPGGHLGNFSYNPCGLRSSNPRRPLASLESKHGGVCCASSSSLTARASVDEEEEEDNDSIGSSTSVICHKCGEVFTKWDGLESHHLSSHAVTELVEGDSSRKIVEIICRANWLKSESSCGRIERVLKVHNMQKTLSRFEEYREMVKSKAGKLPKKHPRCLADGNELLRFHGTTVSCYLGMNGSSSLCTSKKCNVCQILRHGFTMKKNTGTPIGVFTTATSGRAFESIDLSEDNPSIRKALLVCRVIAGRVHKPLDNYQELVGQSVFDSLAGKVGPYANIEELYLLNPRALLPCFVVICKP